MALIAVDFDNTINNNFDIKPGERFSKPFPDAANILQAFRADGHRIMIYSCNRQKWVEEWMNHWNLPYDYIWEGEKPICDVYIDDRAVGFRGDWVQTYKDVNEILEARGAIGSSKGVHGL